MVKKFRFNLLTFCLLTSSVLFIFRHPRTIDASMFFLSPFDWVVWSLIVTFAFTTSVLTRYFFQMENRFSMNMSPGNESNYSNSFLMVFGIFLQQGTLIRPCVTTPSNLNFLLQQTTKAIPYLFPPVYSY